MLSRRSWRRGLAGFGFRWLFGLVWLVLFGFVGLVWFGLAGFCWFGGLGLVCWVGWAVARNAPESSNLDSDSDGFGVKFIRS